jgi:nicotinamidase-related amidase
MISNRKMMSAMRDDPPILICADLQIEYITEGRRHVIADAEAITSRCLELMTLWRSNLWPIIHLKRIAQAAWFNPASNLTDWIADLKPRPGELAFEHPLPSAYSSSRFAEYMTNMKSIRCVVSGFSLDETILSTVIDGFHRSHRYQIVSDAAACRRPGIGDAASYKMAVVKVISNFAGILEGADLVEADPAIAVRSGSAGSFDAGQGVNLSLDRP